MRTLRNLMLPATILIVAGGCATGSHIDGRGLTARQTTADDIFFEFENRGRFDVSVYIVTGARVRRLVAHVRALEKTISNIPYSARYGEPFHMVAVERNSGDEVYTPLMVVAPGDLVIWEILSSFQLSEGRSYTARTA